MTAGFYDAVGPIKPGKPALVRAGEQLGRLDQAVFRHPDLPLYGVWLTALTWMTIVANLMIWFMSRSGVGAIPHTLTDAVEKKMIPSTQKTLPPTPSAPRELTRVIGQSEKIQETVEESADELAVVNSELKSERAAGQSGGLEKPIAQNEAVELKLKTAAEELAVVTNALQAELREREVLEHELTAAHAQEKSARDAAFHDSLTSLPNRLLFNDRLEHGLLQAKRHARTLAVMFIDLDGFKAINDTHGHAAGDSVLKTTARRLVAMTRDEDTVSRHGGDEFLYLLLELQMEADAIVVAKKIVAELGQPCDLTSDGALLSLQVGCSIGIAMFPGDGATSEELVKSADRAMYRAKRERTGYALASTMPAAPEI